MHRFFLVIILSLLVGKVMKAEEMNNTDALNFVDAFLQTIVQDEPLPYEFEEKFFWGNPGLGIPLYIEAGKLDDRTGEWVGPRPKVSLLGKLLQKNKTLFLPPENSTKISFCHFDETSNSIFVIYVYYIQPGPDIYGQMASGREIAKTIIFTITNNSRLSISIDLMRSSINGRSIPVLLGFQMEHVSVQAAGKNITKTRPTLPKELLESLDD